MKLLFYIIIAGISFVAYVRYLEATAIFYPSRQILGTPKDIGMDFEDVYFKTQDSVLLHGWWVPSKKSKNVMSSFHQAKTLLFIHGNAGNIGDRLDKMAVFHQLGLNVLIFDYRGYGKSPGRPTEMGMYEDAVAAYDYLMTRYDIDHDGIIVYGASLGGVAAVDLATHRQLAGLILDSTFTTGADMAKRIVPFVPSFLLSIKMDSVKKIKHVFVPKLFIHSFEDETVPIALGERLFEVSPGPKEFLKIAGSHNEGFAVSQRVFVGGIRVFLRKYNLL